RQRAVAGASCSPSGMGARGSAKRHAGSLVFATGLDTKIRMLLASELLYHSSRPSKPKGGQHEQIHNPVRHPRHRNGGGRRLVATAPARTKTPGQALLPPAAGNG